MQFEANSKAIKKEVTYTIVYDEEFNLKRPFNFGRRIIHVAAQIFLHEYGKIKQYTSGFTNLCY